MPLCSLLYLLHLQQQVEFPADAFTGNDEQEEGNLNLTSGAGKIEKRLEVEEETQMFLKVF